MRFLLASLIFIACNNATDTSLADGDSLSKQSESNVSNTSSACGNQILFKEGARITYAQYDGTGKEFARQTSLVKSVDNKNGSWHSVVEMDESGNTAIANAEVEYTCDGKSIRYDMQNLFARSGMEAEAVMTSDLLSFPLQVKTGETLPDATFKMSAKGGTVFSTSIKSRKVESAEKITTPSGTYDCYKITASLDVDIEMPGVPAETLAEMKKSRPASSYTMWFDPSFGIIKMQMYQGDKLQLSSELVNVE